jgi:Zn-dependent protease with chaperone function
VETNGHPEGQLNPFALPPETDARFILLMISALALAFLLSDPLRYILIPDAANPYAAVPPAPGDIPVDEFFQAHVKYGIQLMLASISSLILPLSLIGMTFLLAAVLYWDHPRRIRRRKGTVPLSSRSDPRFEQELAALSTQAGLQSLPNIELGKNLAVQDGQAFGVGRKKSLYLDGGLRILLRKSVENFRAIVRHELAHIVNRDIDKTYFAQSLWIAVVIITILPLVVLVMYFFVSSTTLKIVDGLTSAELQEILFIKFPQFIGFVLPSVGLIILILLIRASLLRTREFYADWRAALWGSASTLASIFELQSRRKKTGLNPLRLHPSPAERLNTLKKPDLLFVVSFDVPFVVGIFTSSILNGLIPIFLRMMLTVPPGINALNSSLIDFARLHPEVPLTFFRPFIYGLLALTNLVSLILALIPFLILAPLAASTIGLQVQRQALADLAGRNSGIRPYLSLAVPSLWMGLGMVVGVFLSPLAVLAPDSLASSIFAMVCLVLFILLIWLVLVYTRFFSGRLLGSHAKFTPPYGKNRLLSALIAILFLSIEMPLVAAIFLNKILAPDMLQALLGLAGLALGMFLLIGCTFAFHWIVFHIYRRIRPVKCPSCGQISSESAVVSRNCQRCGKNMVPWLYVTH